MSRPSEKAEALLGADGHGTDVTTVHSLETGTLTFWYVSHIVVNIVKTTVHPALCDPCNYSLPHLKSEKFKNREIEIQPGFTKLGQACHGKMYGEADPKLRFLRFNPRSTGGII